MEIVLNCRGDLFPARLLPRHQLTDGFLEYEAQIRGGPPSCLYPLDSFHWILPSQIWPPGYWGRLQGKSPHQFRKPSKAYKGESVQAFRDRAAQYTGSA